MIKLAFIVFMSSVIVCCVSKPLGDVANAETTEINSEDFGRPERSVPEALEADSSTKLVESDVKTAKHDENKPKSNLEVDEASSKAGTDAVKEVSKSGSSNIGSTESVKESRSVKSENTNKADETRTENVDESTRKREVDPDDLAEESEKDVTEIKTRRLLIGISLGDDGENKSKPTSKSILGGTRRSSETNLEETLPTHTGHVKENSANSEAHERTASEKSEVNVDVNSTRNSKTDNSVKEISTEQSKNGHKTTASSQTLSTKLTSALAEATSGLKPGKVDHIVSVEENSEKSEVPHELENLDANIPNTRRNREDSESRSDTTHEKGIDIDVKAIDTDDALQSRTAEISSPAQEDNKTGEKLEENKAENDSKSDQTAAAPNTEEASKKASELEPNPKTGKESQDNKEVEQPSFDAQSRSGAVSNPSEAPKEAVSPAGSPGDHSRIGTITRLPIGFHTTVPIPLRRSAHNHPAVVITRVPESDIIALPHEHIQAGLPIPNRPLRRHLERSNEIASDDREENSTEDAKEEDHEAPTAPETLLGVDDYAEDYNNYKLRERYGAPGANPEVKTNRPTAASHKNAEEDSPQSRRKLQDKSIIHGKTSDSAREREKGRTAGNLPPKNVYPGSNYFQDPFVPRYSNGIPQPQTNYFLPSGNVGNQPEMESNFGPNAVWSRPLVNKLIQATTLANTPRVTAQNPLGTFFNPYGFYFPSTGRYF